MKKKQNFLLAIAICGLLLVQWRCGKKTTDDPGELTDPVASIPDDWNPAEDYDSSDLSFRDLNE